MATPGSLVAFDRKVAQRRMFERIDFIARRQDRAGSPMHSFMRDQ